MNYRYPSQSRVSGRRICCSRSSRTLQISPMVQERLIRHHIERHHDEVRCVGSLRPDCTILPSDTRGSQFPRRMSQSIQQARWQSDGERVLAGLGRFTCLLPSHSRDLVADVVRTCEVLEARVFRKRSRGLLAARHRLAMRAIGALLTMVFLTYVGKLPTRAHRDQSI